MSERPSIESLTEALLASYAAEPRISHLDAGALPSRRRAIDLLERLRDLFFPGYFGDRPLASSEARDHVTRGLAAVRESMEQQIAECLAAESHLRGVRADPARHCPRRLTDEFLLLIPSLRQTLALDVQAAYDGDPAARSTDEAVFCYPGVDAVFTYRLAHALHTLGVPLLPRILGEYVHNETGIDIHPAATIGSSFFIDHGTGVVIGETCRIGDRVKLYQGVTLGAMSFARDAEGRLIRNTRRHPTLEDDVIVYANATILGGDTVIGKGSIIGGGVFLTRSVPPNHFVTLKSQELRYRSADVHNRVMMQQGEADDDR